MKTLFLFFALIAGLGAQVQLNLGSATVQAGGMTTIPLSIATAGQAAASVQWEFMVPLSSMQVIGVTGVTKTASCAMLTPTSYRCILAQGNTPLADEVIANVAIQTAANSPTGTFPITMNRSAASTTDARPLGATVQSGSLTITAAPVMISGISCAPDSVPSGGKATCNVSLNRAATASTSVKLGYQSPGVTVTQRVYLTIGAGESSHAFSSVFGSTATDQTVTITAYLNSFTVADTVTVRGTNPPPPPTNYSFWNDSTLPARADDPDSSAVEVGLKFSSSVAGKVTAIRFYKGVTNTGTHSGHLWSASGSLLASVTFSGETSSGWQQMSLSTPVAVTAGAIYTVSYQAPKGQYAVNNNFFTSALTAGPLTATAGVYRYGGVAFPSSTYQQSNYWVDVVFQ